MMPINTTTTITADTAETTTVAAAAPSSVRCEQCDRESSRTIKLMLPDNTARHLCWDCHHRNQKNVNVSRRWKRERRG